ncbi:unnamed protein product [Trypanosoma congolense IL3000]|uniref:WGS project CAEQ00000000 data, annotated contig 245 n=1 Tax=Trypanosoma congolense (strain IL3000) TaxID=1068625 RepID=F9WEA8_TRYCI|nr:unnamed protein product [Trypanosoma congolense IL3000]
MAMRMKLSNHMASTLHRQQQTPRSTHCNAMQVTNCFTYILRAHPNGTCWGTNGPNRRLTAVLSTATLEYRKITRVSATLSDTALKKSHCPHSHEKAYCFISTELKAYTQAHGVPRDECQPTHQHPSVLPCETKHKLKTPRWAVRPVLLLEGIR